MGAENVKYFVNALVMSAACAASSWVAGNGFAVPFGALVGSTWIAYLAWKDQQL